MTLDVRVSLYCYFNDAIYVNFIHALYLKCKHPYRKFFLQGNDQMNKLVQIFDTKKSKLDNAREKSFDIYLTVILL